MDLPSRDAIYEILRTCLTEIIAKGIVISTVGFFLFSQWETVRDKPTYIERSDPQGSSCVRNNQQIYGISLKERAALEDEKRRLQVAWPRLAVSGVFQSNENCPGGQITFFLGTGLVRTGSPSSARPRTGSLHRNRERIRFVYVRRHEFGYPEVYKWRHHRDMA